MRQHVNPLSRFFQEDRELPTLEDLFEQPELPIHLDIGSARGNFLLRLAQNERNWNYVGIEIRQSLVELAERERIDLQLSNLRFLFANANVSLRSWLKSIPNNKLQRVSIQFPDPCFKRRHKKRRVLQPELIVNLAEALHPGSQMFIQSDLLDVIEQMANMIDACSYFESNNPTDRDWLSSNPFKIKTERELYAINKGIPVYRLLYFRNKVIVAK